MSELTFRDRELVALGAALAANCIPCIEHHVPKAREAGLSDSEIAAAIALADQIRQVPARKVLQTAQAASGTASAIAPAQAASMPSDMAACMERAQAMSGGKSCC